MTRPTVSVFHRHALWAAFVILLLTLSLAPAHADPPVVPVRIGTHGAYGRVVFFLPSRTEYRLTREGDRITIQFEGDLLISPPGATPRNVLAVAGGFSRAELVVAAGAVVRDSRAADRLVIDVWDRDGVVEAPAAPRQAATKPPLKPIVDLPQEQPAAVPVATTAPPKAESPAAKPVVEPSQQLPATAPVPTITAPKTEPPTAPREAVAKPPQKPVDSPQQQPAAVPVPMTALPRAEPSSSSPPPPGTEPQSAAPKEAATYSPQPPAPDPAKTPPGETQTAASEQASAATQSPPLATAVETQGKPDIPMESALTIPANPQLGIAAFRRGSTALIVLDQSLTIDTAAMQDDPVFAAASVQTLPTSTMIRVPLDPSTILAPSRTADAWHLTVVARDPNPRPIQPTVIDDRIALPANMPGAVIGVVDPDTGATLLVGTQRREGQAVPVQRRSAEFILLSTWIGVVVEPIADRVTLRPTPQGFMLDGTPAGLAVSPSSEFADQLAHAAGLTRRFDFPSQPKDIAMQRLRRQMGEDAATPPLARAPRRREVARTMISLGLGAEAAAMLRLAAADDPHEAAAADNAALTSIAALLAHRPDEAGGLTDPRLDMADDIVLWRAVRLAQLQEGSAQAAAMFAATLPLIIAYPPEVRVRLLPLAAETMVAGGEVAKAAALLAARKDDASLDFARGMLLETENELPGALAVYDRLARSRDQSVHARAGVRAVELRLASGAIDTRQAADGLEALLYAWRGDRHERALRERLAELKTRTGAWRSALALLRENETLFAADKAAIHAHLADTFAALLHDDVTDTLPPLELISVVEENADLLPRGPGGDALQARLADRLLALDLPKRAGPVLEKLMQSDNSGAARAGFGSRLAALRLREGDPVGALAALDASTAADLPTDLLEKRTLLAATANARRGDGERALAALGSLDSAAADEARATILERSNDWPAALQALADYAAKTVPPDGKLNDAQRRTLLRLATAAGRAGDDATLSRLRQRDTSRMGSGPIADLFRLLTAEQVRSVSDLKRSGQEAALARTLPAQLKTIQPAASQTP